MVYQVNFDKALQAAFAQALSDQPVYKRRAASLTSLAALVIQLVQVSTVYLTDAPLWVAAVVGVVVYVAEVVVQAGTKNGLGHYQADQIAEAAEKAGVTDTVTSPQWLTRSTADLARELEVS